MIMINAHCNCIFEQPQMTPIYSRRNFLKHPKRGANEELVMYTGGAVVNVPICDVRGHGFDAQTK